MVDAVKVITAKKEVTYGTDSVPTTAANAILTRNFSATPVQNEQLDRNLDLPSYGATATVPSAERAVQSYEVEMAGSGTAGTAPAWMVLLEACGMAAPVLSAGVSATQNFAPAGAAATSLTQHHWISNQRRKMLGSHGTFTLDMTAGAFPFFGFQWTGLLPAAAPFDTNVPAAADFTSWRQPLEVNDANTDFTLDGYAAILTSLQLNANVVVALQNKVGRRYIRRGGHSITGTAVIEAPELAAKDYLSQLRNGSLTAMAVQQGVTAGNIIQLAAPKVQITSIAESEQDDVLIWTLGLTLTVDGGSPDLTITAR